MEQWAEADGTRAGAARFEALGREALHLVDLHWFGGFVLIEDYDVARSTIDVDVLDIRGADLADIAGARAKAARFTAAVVRVDVVTAAAIPDDYESRLIE